MRILRQNGLSQLEVGPARQPFYDWNGTIALRVENPAAAQLKAVAQQLIVEKGGKAHDVSRGGSIDRDLHMSLYRTRGYGNKSYLRKHFAEMRGAWTATTCPNLSVANMASEEVIDHPHSVDASSRCGRQANVQGFWASPIATRPSGTISCELMMLFAPVAPFTADPGWSKVFGPTKQPSPMDTPTA